ncbi:hypothetical protein NIES4075_65500 [Tolypothrix sp. NIES-4075]|uniref:hypothetical protein n=1 Tax=Tolypothrix sp. NIES-4075 TaxID=2005459 RepID=UPI000B5C6E85|nr:hypothetical protein [Tolypothrix sp. NIES-4075]GAX45529.1 hypothetical protein NIES4075_65500 [Tolypothrix sp. NIES-4075]
MTDKIVRKQEVLINGIQTAIDELLDSAGSAEDSNEVENYMRAVKPLTNALINCSRMDIQSPVPNTSPNSAFGDMMVETFANINCQH